MSQTNEVDTREQENSRNTDTELGVPILIRNCNSTDTDVTLLTITQPKIVRG
jgi:hypothetical protein